jgi:hypothetical protein
MTTIDADTGAEQSQPHQRNMSRWMVSPPDDGTHWRQCRFCHDFGDDVILPDLPLCLFCSVFDPRTRLPWMTQLRGFGLHPAYLHDRGHWRWDDIKHENAGRRCRNPHCGVEGDRAGQLSTTLGDDGECARCVVTTLLEEQAAAGAASLLDETPGRRERILRELTGRLQCRKCRPPVRSRVTFR